MISQKPLVFHLLLGFLELLDFTASFPPFVGRLLLQILLDFLGWPTEGHLFLAFLAFVVVFLIKIGEGLKDVCG